MGPDEVAWLSVKEVGAADGVVGPVDKCAGPVSEKVGPALDELCCSTMSSYTGVWRGDL